MKSTPKKMTMYEETLREKYNHIKPFVKGISLKNLTPAKKREITNYYREVRRIEGRPSFVYNSPNYKSAKLRKREIVKLRTLQEFSQHNPSFRKLKVAFIPTAIYKPHIRIKRGNVSISGENIEETAIKFPRMRGKVLKEFIKSPAKFISKQIAKLPKNSKIALRVGKSKFRIAETKQNAGRAIEDLLNAIDNGTIKSGGGDLKKHIWGLTVYKFKNQKAEIKYREKEKKFYDAKKKFTNPVGTAYKRKIAEMTKQIKRLEREARAYAFKK